MTDTHPTFDRYIELYEATVEAYIRDIPMQMRNRSHYLDFSRTARLGRLSGDMTAKNGKVIGVDGDTVLFAPDPFGGPQIMFWKPDPQRGYSDTVSIGCRVCDPDRVMPIAWPTSRTPVWTAPEDQLPNLWKDPELHSWEMARALEIVSDLKTSSWVFSTLVPAHIHGRLRIVIARALTAARNRADPLSAITSDKE